ncbi:MAG: hypothetical protein EBS34_08145 [Flavobacteriales bacterium]|nr:hypothetical protein [Flavobacteriales bacterium]
MRTLVKYSLFFILVSCSSQHEENPLDGNSLIPEEKKEKNAPIDIEKKEFLDTSKYLLCLNSDSINFKGFHASYTRSKDFIDRFAMDSSLLINFKVKSGISVFHEIHFFRDSIQAKNAFFNWLDEEKGSFVGGKTTLGKTNQLVILSERHFQVFKSKLKFNEEKVRKLSAYFIEKDRILYFLKSDKKETIWYKVIENNKIELPNEASK